MFSEMFGNNKRYTKELYSTDEIELKVYLLEYVIETITERYPYNLTYDYNMIDQYVREVVKEFWEDTLCTSAIDVNYFSIVEVVEAVYLEHCKIICEIVTDTV